MRLLVLGGTGEARALATRLVDAGIDVVSSLAGQDSQPTLPAGRVRVGRFDGADGLVIYLRRERIHRVVDATHPFASAITKHAVEACSREGTPLLVLRRPGWSPEPGDLWTRVPDMAAAAGAVSATPTVGSVFLTIGRKDLALFADDTSHEFVVRSIDRPSGRIPPRSTLLLQKGPFDAAGEQALMRRHGVSLVVTKDSGGELTAAKLVAARELGIPVVVVDRPELPRAHVVTAIDRAVAWAISSGRDPQSRPTPLRSH